MKYVFMRFPQFSDKAVTLSYDDGSVYDRELIEIMSEYGLKGTFNINSGLFAKDGENSTRLTEPDAFQLYSNASVEVAIHGSKHLSLSEIDDGMATNEIIADRLKLESMFGTLVNGMAYSGGSYDDRIVQIAKNCGIHYARTTQSTEQFDLPTDWMRLPATCHHDNPRLMDLAHAFIEMEPHWYYWCRTPRLFYLWGHSSEFHNHNNWNVIREYASYVGGRNDVWYATNGEIYQYVQAFKSLEFSASGDYVFNPSYIVVYLNYYNREYVLKPGSFTDISC